MPRERSPRARKLIAGLQVGVLVGLVAAAAAYFRPGFLSGAEFFTYDIRARYAADKLAASKEIVLIHIDEASLRLAEKNFDGVAWPWPRSLYAYITEHVAAGQPKAIVWDFFFQGMGQQVGTGLGDNATFAEEMAKNGKTVIGFFQSRRMTAETSADPWAVRLVDFPSRAEAEKASLALLAFARRVFLVPEGDKVAVWLGGGIDAADAVEIWKRTCSYFDDLGVFFPGIESQDQCSAAQPPAARKLGDAEMKLEFLDEHLVRQHHRLDLAPPGLELQNLPTLDPPLSLFAVAAHLGGVVQQPEKDGVMRAYSPVVANGQDLYPSLALAAYLVAHPKVKPAFDGNTLVLGDRRIPLDDRGRFGVFFHGKSEVYPHHRAYDVLTSYVAHAENQDPEATKKEVTVPSSVFKDKYVIVSATAAAMVDLRPSPLSDRHLGAAINATALDNLLSGETIVRAPAWLDALLAFLIAVALSLYVIAIWTAIPSGPLAFLVTTLAVLLVLGGYLVISGWLYVAHHVWLAMVLPIGGGVLSTIAALLVESVVERKDRRFVQEALGRYTSKALVQEIIAHPEYLSLGGQKREISCYFSDIAGFTTISENLTAERLVHLLNDYLTIMSEIVDKYGGYVDKYIGDAVMAFWGGLIPDEQHALHAVRAAIEMRRACLDNAARWKRDYGVDVMARAGVNSGHAVVGNMGSRDKYNYTVMGDMVNLASRLEGANKPYGTLLMISEFCYEKCKDDVEVRTLDLMTVKGKEQPVTVYEVLEAKGMVDPKTRRCIDLFHEGLALYRSQKWIEAIDKFNDALNVQEDGPSRHYIKRCEHFLDEPPGPSWDGVWHMKEK